jgi:hypothetical protein
MATYEAEPGTDPTKPRRVRKPSPEPKRVPEALQSLREDRPYRIKADTEDEAKQAATEIIAAVRWLRKWGGKDCRVAPYVRQHFIVNGKDYDDRELDGIDVSKVTSTYWACEYLVHPPFETGLRLADPRTRANVQYMAQEGKFAAGQRPGPPVDRPARAVPEPAPARPRRTVAVRRTEDLPPRATRTLISQQPPGHVTWGIFCCLRGWSE